jgi:hypothetical protein
MCRPRRRVDRAQGGHAFDGGGGGLVPAGYPHTLQPQQLQQHPSHAYWMDRVQGLRRQSHPRLRQNPWGRCPPGQPALHSPPPGYPGYARTEPDAGWQGFASAASAELPRFGSGGGPAPQPLGGYGSFQHGGYVPQPSQPPHGAHAASPFAGPAAAAAAAAVPPGAAHAPHAPPSAAARRALAAHSAPAGVLGPAVLAFAAGAAASGDGGAPARRATGGGTASGGASMSGLPPPHGLEGAASGSFSTVSQLSHPSGLGSPYGAVGAGPSSVTSGLASRAESGPLPEALAAAEAGVLAGAGGGWFGDGAGGLGGGEGVGAAGSRAGGRAPGGVEWGRDISLRHGTAEVPAAGAVGGASCGEGGRAAGLPREQGGRQRPALGHGTGRSRVATRHRASGHGACFVHRSRAFSSVGCNVGLGLRVASSSRPSPGALPPGRAGGGGRRGVARRGVGRRCGVGA